MWHAGLTQIKHGHNVMDDSVYTHPRTTSLEGIPAEKHSCLNCRLRCQMLGCQLLGNIHPIEERSFAPRPTCRDIRDIRDIRHDGPRGGPPRPPHSKLGLQAVLLSENRECERRNPLPPSKCSKRELHIGFAHR